MLPSRLPIRQLSSSRAWGVGPYRSPAEVAPEVRAKVKAMLAGSAQRWDYSRLERALDPPAVSRISAVRSPTLLVLGSLDNPDIVRIGDQLDAKVQGVERIEIDGVAHMVNLEVPDRFNEVLLDFLRRR